MNFLPLHQISICISPCCLFTLWPFSFSYLNVYIYIHVCTYVYMYSILLLLHLNNKIVVCYCCYNVVFLFMRVYMWLRERDWWWWCSEKEEEEKPLFFLLSCSLSIVFDWCDIWRRRPISLFFFLPIGFYLLAKSIHNELWFDEERNRRRERERKQVREDEQDKIIAYTIETSEAAAIRHQNKTTDERQTSGEIIFLLLLQASHKK